MRVKTTATYINHRTNAARPGQSGEPMLTRFDALMLCGFVERVVEDVQAGRGRTVEGGLQRIRLLDLTIGLDHQQIRRRQAERLHPAGLATQGVVNRVERADGKRCTVS